MSSESISGDNKKAQTDNVFNDAYLKVISEQLAQLNQYLVSQDYSNSNIKFDQASKVSETMTNAFLQLLNNQPENLLKAQVELWQGYTKIWQDAFINFWGQDCSDNDSSNKAVKDKRFDSENWNNEPFFSFIKDCYLHTSEKVQGLVNQIEGLDEKTSREVDFYTRLFLDAISPSNFVATNPDVLQKTYMTKGQNLINGFENILEDLKRNEGSGVLNIKMTDLDQFKIGENIARTKGKVVYQNRLFQLIQYQATTEKVYQKPLLIIPPFINKYYILDLTEKKSFVQWVVDQGYSVFMVSWVNPDKSYRDTEFEDYMSEGIIQAAKEVLKITNEKTINAIGYCIGGTVLAATLSYLKKKKQNLFESATFFTTLIDFSDPGDLGVFLSEEQVELLENEMKKDGFLDGRRLASSFNLLRSNDLIWNYFVSNYLCGEEPFPLDLLYWNSDSTNLAYKSHSYYLRKLYLENKLIKPNALTFDGLKINIEEITTPSIFISTEKDHIAPWESTYLGAMKFSGEKEFVLAGSGHIAGIINPPTKQKYGYKTNIKLEPSSDKWYDSAQSHQGSWWGHWEKWLRKYSGKKIKKLSIGNGKVKPIEDAPGSYVKVSILNQ